MQQAAGDRTIFLIDAQSFYASVEKTGRPELAGLTPDDTDQLTLFTDRTRLYRLEQTLDSIKDQYGSASIVRASSFLDSGVAKERAEQIGGHYR